MVRTVGPRIMSRVSQHLDIGQRRQKQQRNLRVTERQDGTKETGGQRSPEEKLFYEKVYFNCAHTAERLSRRTEHFVLW